MEEFSEFLKQRGVTVQLLDTHHILIGYQGRWEIFFNNDENFDNENIFDHIWSMLLGGHWIEPYLPEGLIGFVREYGYEDFARAWTDWQADKVYYSKFKALLAEDHELFVEEALKE